jgi:hypothetical protein
MATPVPSIIGEPFDGYVAKQIELRQKKLGQYQKDNKILIYETGKNPWIRLCSSVDINREIANTFNGKYNGGNIPSGNSLASFYMLQGGVFMGNTGGTPGKLKGGIENDNYSKTYVSTKAYGFDSSAEYGLSPMPGITGIDVVSQNQGSLREATIKITCHNLSQFETIELLFLRLKYTILLEWGHSIYFENGTDNLITTPINDVYTKFLDVSKLPPSEEDSKVQIVLDLIEKQRQNTSGNYDAFLGWVTNYEWEILPGGVYNITLKAISHGDVIESLSIVSPRPNKSGGEDTTKQDLTTHSTIGIILNGIKAALDGDDFFTFDTAGFETTGIDNNLGRIVYFENNNALSVENIKNLLDFTITPYKNPRYGLGFKEAIRIEPDDGDNQYYIKLGALLRIIEGFCLKYDNGKPIFSINWDYVQNFSTNFEPWLISNNIKVCYAFPNFNFTNVVNYNSIDVVNDTGLGNFVNEELGIVRYMNIQVNIDYILSILTENIDSEGNLSIYDFLSALLTEINGSLCNLINLEPYQDYESNTLYIVDRSSPIKPNKLPTRINVGIVRPNEGNFVRQFSLKTEITPNLSTQIAIGAQSNNQDVGVESVAFSRWNKGLTDRIIPNKATTADPNPVVDEEEREKYEGLRKDFKSYLNSLGSGEWEDDFFNYGPSVKDYINSEKAKSLRNDPELQSPTFIPISLNLTLDGISGVKIFQKYTITEDYLPKNYRDNIEFLTKGISHTIDGSGWTTKIESLSIPKGTKYSTNIQDFNASTSGEVSNQTSNSSPSLSFNFTPQSKTLEQVLLNTGYAKGTFKYELAYQIGKKEGFKQNSTNRPSRNNNPGNLVYAQSFKSIDPNVVLEPPNPKKERRFAKFSTPELGVRALVENKIVLWANGGYPATIVNGSSQKAQNYRATYKVPASLNGIAGKQVKMTLEQFMYTYAPPSENNTEGYINNIVNSMKQKYSNFSRFSKLIDFLNK